MGVPALQRKGGKDKIPGIGCNHRKNDDSRQWGSPHCNARAERTKFRESAVIIAKTMTVGDGGPRTGDVASLSRSNYDTTPPSSLNIAIVLLVTIAL